ncbi:MAG: hypothetical protein ACXWNK_07925 [Vulcanimicrobiaceae bacterium]
MRILLSFSVAAVLLATLAHNATASPSPKAVQGGANQAEGVTGTFPHPVFDGVVRIKPTYFGPVRPTDKLPPFGDGTPTEDKQALIFTAVISNGQSQPYLDDPSFHLADADGVLADTRAMGPNSFNLPQAAAARVTVVFWAPKDFVPHHILFTCNSTHCKPIRIMLPAQK